MLAVPRYPLLCALALIGLLCGVAPAAHARDEYVWATGRVLDASGKPLADALVAIYDDSNKVVDHARTDKDGNYALAVPRRALHIDKKRKSFFTQVVGGVSRFVGGVAGFVANPVRAGVSAVASGAASAATDPLTRGGIAAGGAAADQLLSVLSPRERRPTVEEARKQPGALLIKAVVPGRQDLVGITRVYWMQEEIYKAGGKESRTLAAWLDPLRMSPLDAETPSAIQSDLLTFTSARLEPSIAAPGQKVKIVAALPAPPEPQVYLVVVARNNRTGQKWWLQPDGEGRYFAEIEVDKRFPRDDQVISILAYAAETQQSGRREDAERALEKAGMWDVSKPFRYDPLLVVSRNRADLVLTVLGSASK